MSRGGGGDGVEGYNSGGDQLPNDLQIRRTIRHSGPAERDSNDVNQRILHYVSTRRKALSHRKTMLGIILELL